MPASDPNRRTQTERVEESTRRLVEAATSLIVEQGFERTTAAQIADRAGYSRSMVRERFGSKEALLEWLFETEIPGRLEQKPPSPDSTGLDRLLSETDDLLAWSVAAPELAKAFMVLSFEAAGPLPTVRPWYRAWLTRYEAQTADNLRLGQRDGSVREGLDIAYEAKAFTAYGLSLAFRWTLDFDGFPFADEVGVWRAGTLARYRA